MNIKQYYSETNYPITSYSWTILSFYVAIKKLDRSAFLHSGTGIPIEIRDFFGVKDMIKGEKRNISILYKGKNYNAHYEMDVQNNPRTRLMWKSDFSELLCENFPEWFKIYSMNKKISSKPPEIRFKKINDKQDCFDIEFVNPNEIELDIKSEIEEDYEPKSEGVVKYFYSKKYERNPENRRKAIEIHGTICTVCGFDFEKHYGKRGKGYIEIHHIKPLSILDEEIVVNPETDLVPLCSNCHKMIHRRKNDFLTIDDLKSIYN